MTRTGVLQSDHRKQEHPDAKKHQIVSFVKSGIRIVGYIFFNSLSVKNCFKLGAK